MRIARAVALVGVMAATVECGKLALSAIPNVEVVTLLLAVYGYSFGWLGVVAAVVFVCIEPLIWGVNTWVITYFLYWPLVALVFCIFGKTGMFKLDRGRANIPARIISAATAVLLTVWFGILSSLVDVGLFSGYFDNFLYRFGIYYSRGIVFYIIQIASNAVLFLTLFPLLCRILMRISRPRVRPDTADSPPPGENGEQDE